MQLVIFGCICKVCQCEVLCTCQFFIWHKFLDYLSKEAKQKYANIQGPLHSIFSSHHSIEITANSARNPFQQDLTVVRKTSYYTATRINQLKSARSKDAYMYFPFGWISTGCLPERFELLSAMGDLTGRMVVYIIGWI